VRDIRPALREFLLGDPNIVAAVIARVYPIRMPQGTKAASVVYTRISGQSGYKMEGPTGLSRTRMQLDAWAPTADAAVSLANFVKDRIDGYRGVMGSDPNAVTVQGVFMADEREDYDDIVQLYRCGRDFFIHHEEL
jgi:hypothetical protein